MASLVYNSALEDIANGNIDCNTDTFKVMLTTSSYTGNKDTHTKRSDVTNEVSGTGYSAGGAAVTLTVTKDTTNDRLDISFSTVTWPGSTITARYCVIYKSRGGASSADELLMMGDFGGDISTTGGTFTLTNTTPLRFQN